MLEDQLFLGRSYESYFDQFEILFALLFADARPGGTFGVWGPPGRFAWKQRGAFGDGLGFSAFVEDAKAQGKKWKPLQAGLFGGSPEQFAGLADAYTELLNKMSWW
jgi:hypothetical protein